MTDYEAQLKQIDDTIQQIKHDSSVEERAKYQEAKELVAEAEKALVRTKHEMEAARRAVENAKTKALEESRYILDKRIALICEWRLCILEEYSKKKNIMPLLARSSDGFVQWYLTNVSKTTYSDLEYVEPEIRKMSKLDNGSFVVSIRERWKGTNHGTERSNRNTIFAFGPNNYFAYRNTVGTTRNWNSCVFDHYDLPDQVRLNLWYSSRAGHDAVVNLLKRAWVVKKEMEVNA